MQSGQLPTEAVQQENEGLYGKIQASPIVNEFSLNNSNCLFILQILKRLSLSRFKIYTNRTLPELSFRLWVDFQLHTRRKRGSKS